MKATTIIGAMLFVIVIVSVSYFSSFKKNEIIADHITLENALRNEILAKDLYIEALNKEIVSDKEYQEALKLRIEVLEKNN